MGKLTASARLELYVKLRAAILEYLDSLSVDATDRETVYMVAPEIWNALKGKGLIQPGMDYDEFKAQILFASLLTAQ